MEKPNFSKEEVFEACLQTLSLYGWGNFSFAAASETSAIPLLTFSSYFSSPSDVMVFLFQKLDCEVLSQVSDQAFPSPREALFDLLMLRFEAAQPYKKILQSFWETCLCTPEELPSLAAQGFSSMAWILEAAHLESRGLGGILRVQGLFTLYLLTLKVWLSDESPGLEETMVYLDKGLTRLEKLATFLPFLDGSPS